MTSRKKPVLYEQTSAGKTCKMRNCVIVGAVLLVGLVGGWIYLGNTKTYPLGDPSKLEYVGKSDYGCWWVCDSNPASDYYYATDMNVDDVVAYFKETTLSQGVRVLDGVADFTLKTENDDSIAIYYYIDKNSMSEIGFTKKTNKKAILSIPSFEYDTARASI